MTFDCTGSDWARILPLIFGLLLGALATGAWFFPNRPFMWRFLYERYPEQRGANRMQSLFGYTREEMGPVSLWSTRVIATLGALLFGGLGIYGSVSALTACGLPLPNSIQIGIGFRYSPSMLLFIAAALAFAAYYIPKIKLNRRILFAVLNVAWAFAGSEAATFHVGPIATTWGLLAFAIWIVFAIGAWRWRAPR